MDFKGATNPRGEQSPRDPRRPRNPPGGIFVEENGEARACASGRPRNEKLDAEPADDEDRGARLSEDLSRRIDAWIATQPEPRPTRREAIRRLLAEALGKADDAGR